MCESEAFRIFKYKKNWNLLTFHWKECFFLLRTTNAYKSDNKNILQMFISTPIEETL